MWAGVTVPGNLGVLDRQEMMLGNGASEHRVDVFDAKATLACPAGEWARLRSLPHNVRTFSNDTLRFATENGLGVRADSQHVVVWQNGGRVSGILVGRLANARDSFRIGYGRIRSLRLKSLDVVHGGVLVDGNDATLSRISEYLEVLLRERVVDVVRLSFVRVGDPIIADVIRRIPALRVADTPQPHWRARLLD